SELGCDAHFDKPHRMSAYDPKRTCASASHMSATIFPRHHLTPLNQKSAPSSSQRRLVPDTESPTAFVLVTVTVLQRTKPLSELFWTMVRWRPKASFCLMTLCWWPRPSLLCVTLVWLPKRSVFVMVTESAEAVPANVRDIASAAVITAK